MHQPVKKSSALYEARRFITVFTRAVHLFSSWTVSVRSTPFFKALFRVSLATMPRFPKWSHHFLQISPPKPCAHLFFRSSVLHAPHISSLLIWSPTQYLLINTNHAAPQYAFFSSLLLPLPRGSRYLPQHRICKRLQADYARDQVSHSHKTTCTIFFSVSHQPSYGLSCLTAEDSRTHTHSRALGRTPLILVIIVTEATA